MRNLPAKIKCENYKNICTSRQVSSATILNTNMRILHFIYLKNIYFIDLTPTVSHNTCPYTIQRKKDTQTFCSNLAKHLLAVH